MSTTNAHSSITTTVNNGGTVVNGGNVSSDNPMTSNIGLNELNTGEEYGSTVIEQDGTTGDFSGVATAKSGGAGLAYFPKPEERNFLLRGAGDTSAKVNNAASTAVSLPSSTITTVNAIHKSVSTRRLGASATTSFDILARPSTAMVPGRTKGAGAGSLQEFVQADDGSTAATDQAASPSLQIPGELTYHFGSLAAPTTDEYKALNSYEDHTDTSSP